jgi:hypothetical protein
MPQAAPKAKEGSAPAEAPKSIAGLIGNMFGGSKTETAPAATAVADNAPVSLRGSKTTVAAKTKPAAAPAPEYRTASTPVGQPKPPKAVVEASAQPTSRAPERELRTAFTAPQAAPSGNTLSGAQPVVPTGSFDSRWSGFR